jgi:hypothetical protein
MKRIALLVTVALVMAAMTLAMVMPAFAKPSANSNIQAKQNYCEQTYADNNGQLKKCLREEF